MIAACVSAVIAGGMYGLLRMARWRHELSVAERLAIHRGRIWAAAEAAGLPPELVMKVVRHESGGDHEIVSHAGAVGLMQVMPATAEEVRRTAGLPEGSLTDPDHNLAVGTAYLAQLIRRFDGDLWLALAAYNAGPTKMAQLRREHPDLSSRELVNRHAPRETAAYCRKILASKAPKLDTGAGRP